MSQENLEAVKNVIRKLFRLGTNHAAFEGEMQNALTKARELMDKYHLTRADIDQHEAAADVEQMIRDSAYSQTGRLSTWEAYLAIAVTETVGTIGWYHGSATMRRTSHGTVDLNSGGPQAAVEIFFYGPAEDVEIAKTLFYELSQTIMAMALLRYGGVFRGAGRSYCEGFTRELIKRSRQGIQERSEQCRAIVAQKAETAKRWLRQECGISLCSRGRSSAGQDAEAYGAGRRDGAQTSMSANRRAKLGGAPKALPGR